MNEHPLRCLQVAKQALKQYDTGDVHFDESKEAGDIGFAGYRMVKFYAKGASGTFLINVHDAYRGRNIYDYRATICSHLLWLEALDHDTDLVIQKPVRNRSGEFITEVQLEGERSFIVTLLNWVEGEVVWDNYGEKTFVDLSPGVLRNVGTVLGRIHRHSSQWTLPEGFTRPKSESEVLPKNLNRLRQAADEGRMGAADFAVLDQTVSRFLVHVAELGESPQTWGLLHGDFSCGNCVVHRDEVRPIDFDWCCFGYFLGDLGWSFAVNNMNGSLRQAFLGGYQQYHALPGSDLQMVEGFFIESYVRLLSWESGNPDRHFPARSHFVEGACRKYLNDEPFLLEWMEEL